MFTADDIEDGSLPTSVGLVHLKLQKQRVDSGGEVDSQTSKGPILSTEPSSRDSTRALFAGIHSTWSPYSRKTLCIRLLQ